MIGDAIAWAMGRFIVGLFVAAFTLGALAVWAIPKLWRWIKPFIHQVTA
jgi:hypothetical protein